MVRKIFHFENKHNKKLTQPTLRGVLYHPSSPLCLTLRAYIFTAAPNNAFNIFIGILVRENIRIGVPQKTLACFGAS
jgi:hypothetical protein